MITVSSLFVSNLLNLKSKEFERSSNSLVFNINEYLKEIIIAIFRFLSISISLKSISLSIRKKCSVIDASIYGYCFINSPAY